MDIDLVYLWVDGNDEKWLQEKRTWENKLNIKSVATNICRFSDNGELKYAIRSAMKNAPWIHKIFIVTNGQIPSWLNVNNPKIRIVKHSEIMPKTALPTFNSEAIETCIANIPDLSEYFLYANDDYFINKPITPDYFFDDEGKPIIRMVIHNWTQEDTEKSLYRKNIVYSMNLIKNRYGKEYKYQDTHNILAWRKSYIKECTEEFPEDVEKTMHAKFRMENSFQCTIYSFYMLANNLGTLKICEHHFANKPIDNLLLPLRSKSYMKNRLDISNPTLFCINDDEKTKDNERYHLEDFLVEIFPEKSELELLSNDYKKYDNKTKKIGEKRGYTINLLNLLPLIKLVQEPEKANIYLFNKIPFLTISNKKNKIKIRLFNIITLFKIRPLQ